MSTPVSFLCSVKTPLEVITPIPSGQTFPESLTLALELYREDINEFARLIRTSTSAAELLEKIRTPGAFSADTRMSLLKLFRRCVSPICDTENTKKITKVATRDIVASYGNTFKSIAVLKEQFAKLSDESVASLAVLLAENDQRGQSGYVLAGLFFDWFEETHGKEFTIKGPRGAGRDIELSSLFPEFTGSCPCDFVITDNKTGQLVAIGFARYDATRGGSQSDDRTGGNANKVDKARELHRATGRSFRLIFLADGPGLAHRDTWQEACNLDGAWEDNVRVMTLKLAPTRLSASWLRGQIRASRAASTR
jgi:hypothetical protein